MFLKSKGKDVKIVERNFLQLLNRKKYILEGVQKMDEQKKEILEMVQALDNEAFITFIYNIIRSLSKKLDSIQ